MKHIAQSTLAMTVNHADNGTSISDSQADTASHRLFELCNLPARVGSWDTAPSDNNRLLHPVICCGEQRR